MHDGRGEEERAGTIQLKKLPYLGVDSIEDCLGVAEPLASRVHKLRAGECCNRVDCSLAAHGKALCASGQTRQGQCLVICEGRLRSNRIHSVREIIGGV